MKIEIEGNPGTGNTFSETRIEHVENYNPGAQTVINNYYGTRARKDNGRPQACKETDTGLIRQEILSYVSRLKRYLDNGWKQGYDKLWNDILDIPEVAEKIYDPGKQQGTNFNRNLVANIIYCLSMHGTFNNYNAAQFTEVLEGDKDHSVRHALGVDPDNAIRDEVQKLL